MALYHSPSEILSHVRIPRGSILSSLETSAIHLKPRGSHSTVSQSSSLLIRTGPFFSCCKSTEKCKHSVPFFSSHFSSPPKSSPPEKGESTKLGFGRNWRNCGQFNKKLGFLQGSLNSKNWNSCRVRKKIQRNNCTDSKFAESEPESEERGEEFMKRLEKSWVIRKQPVPMACEKCGAEGSTECPWCRGTGFFILGDNMLCEVPSRNTTCLICQGHGTIQCVDCKGTGFRARWMGQPPTEPHGGERSKL